MWNRFQRTKDFEQPWLLRFYPVSEAELLQCRADFLVGKFQLQIEETTFSLPEYQKFLRSIDQELTIFKTNQQKAFAAERDRWTQAGEFTMTEEMEPPPDLLTAPIPAGTTAVLSPMAANIWQLLVEPGAVVAAGDRLLILEAIKMEIPVVATSAGLVVTIYGQPGQLVVAGQRLLDIQLPGC
jgi:urea carboxylase